MVEFGFRSGKNRLTLDSMFDVQGYMKALGDTNLKIMLFIALGVGLFLRRTTGLTGTISIITLVLGLGLLLTYPIYLIMRLAGDKSISNVLRLYVLNYIISFVLLSILPEEYSLFILWGAWLLSVGLIYPKRVTLVDALLVQFALMFMTAVIVIITGVSVIGVTLLGSSLTQSIIGLG